MSNAIPSAGAEVPERIQLAERWRLVGERLRTIAPRFYEQFFAMLVMSLPDDSDDVDADHNPNSFSA